MSASAKPIKTLELLSNDPFEVHKTCYTVVVRPPKLLFEIIV